MESLSLHDDDDESSSISEGAEGRDHKDMTALAHQSCRRPRLRIRHWAVVALVAIAFVCLGVALIHKASAPVWLGHKSVSLLKKLFAGHSLVPMAIYPIAVLFIFMLERRFPAVPTQKTLSTAVFHDVLWALISGGFEFLVLKSYGAVLYKVYMQHLSFLTLPVPSGFPMVAPAGSWGCDRGFPGGWVAALAAPSPAIPLAVPCGSSFAARAQHAFEFPNSLRGVTASSTMVVIPLLMLNVQQPDDDLVDPVVDLVCQALPREHQEQLRPAALRVGYAPVAPRSSL